MLRYKSAWMPVAGTAEEQMQNYSWRGGSWLLGRGLGPGGGHVLNPAGGSPSPHIRHLKPHCVSCGPSRPIGDYYSAILREVSLDLSRISPRPPPAPHV